jgi:formamidopyrimidine-DNA glycosylase
MPELPEVEVVRRGLAEHVSTRTISNVDVIHARAVRRQEGPLDVALVGRAVRCVSRRGKYLWLPLDDGTALVAHLGMSGQLLMQPKEAPDEKHLRVRIRFDDEGRELRFVDQRTFGGLMTAELVGDDRDGHLPADIVHIARDPLDPYFDDVAFVERLRSKDTQMKRALLDQSLVSGIGNIYADESLWRARLHGRRLAGSVGRAKAAELVAHVRDVMTDALAQGGTSFDALYVNVNGESGYFDRSLDAYGQEGGRCHRCGSAIRREHFMNRSSFFCPRCQRVHPQGRD